jgi:hypothetical protein
VGLKVVGLAVGSTVVGLAVGETVGSAVVGLAVGPAVGSAVVGLAVGAAEGRAGGGRVAGGAAGHEEKGLGVGAAVGSAVVGLAVGPEVGSAVVGLEVGPKVGSAVVGLAVGAMVGEPVGLAVVGLAVGAEVGAPVGPGVGDTVGALVVWQSLQVTGHICLKKAVSQSIHEAGVWGGETVSMGSLQAKGMVSQKRLKSNSLQIRFLANWVSTTHPAWSEDVHLLAWSRCCEMISVGQQSEERETPPMSSPTSHS